MEKEQIKKEILKITDWRHPFELEPGIWVKLFRDWHKDWHMWRVETLMPTIETIARHILPAGLQGTSVLDIGCWDGFYGFQFLKKGAAYLKGIDLRDEAIRRANLLKSYFGYSNSDFETGNIQDVNLDKEKYDITLMYGILYHLSAPIDVVKKLGNITGSMLLLNTYASGEPEPLLKLKRENPGKDSTGFQELVTNPSESAVIDMLDFSEFDVILRDYPYPFYERYQGSDFGFFYALKSGIGKERIQALFNELNVQETYNPKLKQHQIVRLKFQGTQKRKLSMRKRMGLKLHSIIDKVFQE
jgi:SAM-dependent methyltransferase